MSTYADIACSWVPILAEVVGTISACFFVVAVYGHDKPLAWISVSLYVPSSLIALWCYWGVGA